MFQADIDIVQARLELKPLKQTNCPRCHTPPAADNDEQVRLVSCENCGLVWTLIAEPVDTDQLYKDDVYQVVDNRGSVFEKIIVREAASVLTRARSLLTSAHPRLLDFGCGKGQFMKQAVDMGWQAVGVETSPERARFAKEKYGQDVSDQFYEDGVIASGEFDLITLNHVLEHLPQPLNLLGELLNKNLSAQGLAYIEVPRLNSWQSAIAGEDWMHLDLPKHLSHWTEKQLMSELEKLNYTVVAHRQFSFHLGVLGMLQALGTKIGYRENIIVGLKRQRSPGLLLLVACLTPVAFIAESLACLFNRSGVMGFFARRANTQV